MTLNCFTLSDQINIIFQFLGDSEHKPHVSSTPDIVSVQLDGDEDFVILACDGLWDSVKYEEAAQTVYNHVQLCPGKIRVDKFCTRMFGI